MVARMPRYGPVAAGTVRHPVCQLAARTGRSQHFPARSGTVRAAEQQTLNLRVRKSSLRAWPSARYVPIVNALASSAGDIPHECTRPGSRPEECADKMRASAQPRTSRRTGPLADLVRGRGFSSVVRPWMGLSRPWLVRGPSPPSVAVRGNDGYTDRAEPRTMSAMRPWTAQHRGLQRPKVTHHGTEKKRPA